MIYFHLKNHNLSKQQNGCECVFWLGQLEWGVKTADKLPSPSSAALGTSTKIPEYSSTTPKLIQLVPLS